MNKSFKTKAKTDLDLDEKGNITRSKLPDYFTARKEGSEVKVQHDKMTEEKKNKYLNYSKWQVGHFMNYPQ